MEQVVSIDWEGRARALALATIGWNVLEGVVAVGFGVREDSVALWGFGVDSWVEVGSAAVVYWKLTRGAGCATTRRRQERTATRWVSALLLMLAASAAVGALLQLAGGEAPATPVPALLISAVSLSFMGFLWRAKTHAARALDSRTLEMDAACSLGCIHLSLVLLAGALVQWLAPGLGWVDAVAALALAGMIAREGWSGWRAAAREDFSGGCGCA
jgi:divalent metal cation (Fe/Co/Zn/Cd) transporter